MTTRHVLTLALCIALWAVLAKAADWPCYLGANRDNTSAEKDLKLWTGDSPKVSWRKNVGTGHSCFGWFGISQFFRWSPKQHFMRHMAVSERLRRWPTRY